MNRSIIYLGCLALLLFISGCSDIELKMNLEQGKTYGLEQTVNQMVRQTGQLFQQSIIFNFDFSPQEIMENGEMKSRLVLRRVRYEAIYPFGQVEKYDSKTDISKAPPQLMGNVYVFLLNEPLSITFQSDGSVTMFGGIDRLIDSYINAMPASQMVNANALKQQYNDANYKQTMNNIFNFYPPDLVSIGSSWQVAGKINLKGKNDFETKVTLKNFHDNGEAILKFEAPIVLNDVEGNILGVTGTLDVKGTKSGSLRLDAKSGWPIEGSTTQTYDGYISDKSTHTAIWVQNVVSLKGRLPAN